ncbi:carboxymethylenebutenolidase [Saccharata proteae CBS 121410]|uniref:Carboxymethylenebutenolidase n=1 Tax=Saccharata proteae CBS 121410 TaxID=1314787 RepID=A0A9P4HP00_9PEZI|nr:carboxymethylenebutenolidase [Saccharata proteae CBS 121410]
MSQHSAACCSIPPVVTEGYEPKGKYIEIDGMKTYHTGPSSAKHAILVIYDIFGFFPQTLQGADILATSDKERQYQVFMPDFFEGKPADISWYPPDNDEKGQKLGQFFQTTAAPPKTVPRVPKVVQEINKKVGGLESWAVLGFCWGGKIVNLTSQSGTPFMAAAAAHPAMVDPNDAPNITIPIALLPSKDEDKDAVAKWQQGLKVKGQVEWFNDQIHGFMAARGDLTQEKVRQEYERGYKTVLTFFHENM